MGPNGVAADPRRRIACCLSARSPLASVSGCRSHYPSRQLKIQQASGRPMLALQFAPAVVLGQTQNASDGQP